MVPSMTGQLELLADKPTSQVSSDHVGGLRFLREWNKMLLLLASKIVATKLKLGAVSLLAPFLISRVSLRLEFGDGCFFFCFCFWYYIHG
ncbi:hypothetical protein MLD38_039032 [Melastoma candidum]|uniref:Uncharacterized protein n=1 Tax=Melastoma candidum TaxID=119954 RepID=A0ACB9L1H6_9MYRT|nr:hypothetical protein MLD38_039032 [Melastoma candidum]